MLGATSEDLADCFEVSRSTIDGWIAAIPEFAEGVRQGRDEADVAVVEKLYSRAMGYSYETKKVLLCRGEPVTVPHTVHYPPDIRACIFWLRNRRPQQWRERTAPMQDEQPDWRTLEEDSERARAADVGQCADAPH